MPYITDRGLKGLKQYQYKSAGYTWLDDLHQPFWNGIVEHLPLWLAPNLITLIGTAGLIASYFLYGFYLPALEGAAPWWVYFLGGFSVLFYLHLDCIDGKQARRTKSSSPLGQLFDHGCDALSVHLIVTNLAAALGMSLGWRATLFSVGVMGPWALAHWEEYHSGVMNYGTGYWGVLEANYLVVAGHWVTMLLGDEVWEGKYSSILGWQLPWGLTLRRGDLNLLLVLGAGTQQIFGQIWHTMADKRIQVSVKERGHKQLGRRRAFQHLLQIQLVLVLGSISTLEPVSSVWHARVLLATFGIIYALEMSKLIMSHMAKEPFEISVWPLVGLSATLINSALQVVPTQPLAWLVFAVTLAGYLHYVVSSVNEICAYLNIKCLTIPVLTDEE